MLGDLLIRAGVVDATGLSRARDVQSDKSVSLGKALAALKLANEEVTAAAAKELQDDNAAPFARHGGVAASSLSGGRK